ncbi:MAG: hypothetical protein AAGB93_02775 [Planctomycetota bacterium]
MSHKSQKADETPAASHEHDDDLIVVPKGQSRLRYLATIGLVLFLLVIFVVADLFQSSMTGGGGRTDEVYITWKDPVDGAEHQVMSSEFLETAQLLRMLTRLSNYPLYFPDSLMYGEPDPKASRRMEATEEDVASFFIYEDMARDAGIAVSQAEHVDLLRISFGTSAQLRAAAKQARMTTAQLEDSIRRVERVRKLRDLMVGATSIPDANAVIADWQEQHPEYRFQVASVKRDNFLDQAKTEVVDDEALLAWFRERPQFQQEQLYTEARVVPEVLYVPLGEDAAFDPAKLAEAFPAPEGVDLDEQARNYHRQFMTSRFRVPEDAQEQEEEGGESDDSAGLDDSEEGQGEPELAPSKLFYEFEEVEEQVRREAPIHAAIVALQTDLQDRAAAGEEIDFAAEAERLGLLRATGPEEGYTREEIGEVEGWGSPSIAGQLIFSVEGTILPRVVVSENAMTLGRVVTKKEREEPPFDQIRDKVADQWAEERAGELAVEALESVRADLAEKPEDVELADWNPVVEVEAFKKRVDEAEYGYYERPWLERFSVPDDDFATASPADQYVRTAANLFELEAGQLAPAAASRDGSEAFLVRFDAEREKDPSEIDAQTVLQMRQQARMEDRRAFGAKAFLGDGPWLTERTQLAFPERDRRDAERAAQQEPDDAADGASDDAAAEEGEQAG